MKKTIDLKTYLKAYPDAIGFYTTSDGQVFLKEHQFAAASHQALLNRGLKKPKEIEWVGCPGDETPQVPGKSWTNDRLKAYMDDHSISYESDDNKSDLLTKITRQNEV